MGLKYNTIMNAPICSTCNARKREKGRTRSDGTIWYRATCRLCRGKKVVPDEKKRDITILEELKLLRRYKRAMKVLCERQCIELEDVLKKFAPEES